MKIFDGKLLIRTLSPTLLQISFKLMLNFNVIFKSIAGPDDKKSRKSPNMNGLKFSDHVCSPHANGLSLYLIQKVIISRVCKLIYFVSINNS